jgi:GNAT superfamily N-acetyltransferase
VSPNPALDQRVREFEAQDAPSVSTLICRCLREVNSRDYPRETIEHMTEVFSPSNLPKWFTGMDTVIVLVEGQRILGTGSLKDNRIMTVFVSPDDHKKGIGTKLMDYLEGVATQRGHQTVVLNSSLSSFQFYRGRNYFEKSRIHEKMGGEMIVMEKAI